MFGQLLNQGPGFGCSIVGTSNSFCPDDMWSFGMPMLILLVLAAAGLALYKAWQTSRTNERAKKRVTRILTTVAILAAAYVSIAFVPLIYHPPYGLLIIAVLGAITIMSVY